MNKESNQSILANKQPIYQDFIHLTTHTLLPCTTTEKSRSLPPLEEFIHSLSERTKLSSPTLLLSVLYLLRLKTKLPATAKGASDTPYRLFLASILTSSKYLCDQHSLTSRRLSEMTVYSAKEINSMERSFLSLLRYDLWVTTDHLGEVLMKIKKKPD
ncbi:hypothetical protein G6F48_006746 [Rhizopus delemar]|nr:hypothetical protein G6F48_006746 [Rhizopus delemar]KAG1643901.1 hypothetical protein G6F44_003373 [Rhizopus delemar]